MGASLILTREDKPDPETVRAFGEGLSAYNASFVPRSDWAPRWWIGRDGAGAVGAGCRFVFEFDWTFISWLWVAEPFRRQGEGSRLLQGPLFYPRHGFTEFGRIAGFPAGYDRIWFMKRF
jgi:GNAT superfamily N-acetyltransferase